MICITLSKIYSYFGLDFIRDFDNRQKGISEFYVPCRPMRSLGFL